MLLWCVIGSCGFTLGLTVSGIGDPLVLIEGDGRPIAGQAFQVTVTPLKSGLTLGVLVELNRVRLGDLRTKQLENGSVLIEIPVPAAVESGTLAVTIQAGGTFAARSFHLRDG